MSETKQLEDAKETVKAKPQPAQDEGLRTEPKHVEAAKLPFLGSPE